jgi:hypothetical protein|tara:strand:- start:110 stop:421 length:312 start_codon:yes stop_codon:yes gene_type:complete
MVFSHLKVGYNRSISKKGTKMIDYISLNEGLLELHSGEELVFAGRNAQTLADVAIRNGGMSTHVMCSSTFIEASCGCPESVIESGFRSCKEINDLWKEVCDNV